jgi:hypothetical protein
MSLDPKAARLVLAAQIKQKILDIRQTPLGLYTHCMVTPKGQPLTIKPFHGRWNKAVLEYNKAMIEASRGLSKTTFFIAFVAWLVGCDKNIRVRILSQDDDSAYKRLKTVREIIKSNDLYKMAFGNIELDLKQPNNVSKLTVIRDLIAPEATIEASGVLTSGTGGRCDVLLCDDVCDFRNSIALPALRPLVVHKVTNDWFPTVTSKGKIFFIFTPWHQEDLHASLKKTRKWPHIKDTHGKAGDDYHSIFPELFPRSKLQELRQDLGAFAYARGYLCRLESSGTSIIDPNQLVTYRV